MPYAPVLPQTRQPLSKFPRPRSPEEAVIAIARWTDPITFLIESWTGPVRMSVADFRRDHEVTAEESELMRDVPPGTPAWYRLGSMTPVAPGSLPALLTGCLLIPGRLPREVLEQLDGDEPLGRVLAAVGRVMGLPVSRVHATEDVTPATERTAATAEVSALMYLGHQLVARTWEKVMPWVWTGDWEIAG